MQISLEAYEKLLDRIEELRAENDKLLENAFSTQRWISVNDKLPEDSGQVLAYGAGEIFMAYFDADFHDGAWFKYFLNDDCQDPYLDPYYGEVRCWMPLPEPPEVEKCD